MQQIPGLLLLGMADQKTSVFPFTLKGFTAEDVGKALDNEAIAVRTGHHCAQPILRRFGLGSSIRPSLAFYNTRDEIDSLVSVIWKLVNGQAY